MKCVVITDGWERGASPTSCIGKSAIVPRPARRSTEFWCATDWSIRKNSRTNGSTSGGSGKFRCTCGSWTWWAVRECKILTGIDDHPRFVVVAVLDDNVVETTVTRLTTADLDRLTMRGALSGSAHKFVGGQVQAVGSLR